MLILVVVIIIMILQLLLLLLLLVHLSLYEHVDKNLLRMRRRRHNKSAHHLQRVNHDVHEMTTPTFTTTTTHRRQRGHY